MAWVAIAVVGSAVVGGVASNIAANKAAGAAKSASKSSVAEQQRQFDLARADQAPWRTTGGSALNALAKLYGLSTVDAQGNVIKGSGKSNFSGFNFSPDYQFSLLQGQKAIDRSAAARGGLLSGAAVREGERYASGLASQNFDTYANRLAGIAGVGQTSVQATGALGANAANNISNAYINAGNARASAYMDNGQTIGNLANGAANNYLFYQYMKQPKAPVPG